MNRIHMAEDEDAGLVFPSMRKTGANAVAEAHAAGDHLDVGAHHGEIAGGHAHHAVDRLGVPGRALALHPRP